MNKLPPLLMLSACAAVCRAETEGSDASDLENFNTLRDPTFLSTSASFGAEYFDRNDGAFRNKYVLSGDYAFGSVWEAQPSFLTSGGRSLSEAPRSPNRTLAPYAHQP